MCLPFLGHGDFRPQGPIRPLSSDTARHRQPASRSALISRGRVAFGEGMPVLVFAFSLLFFVSVVFPARAQDAAAPRDTGVFDAFGPLEKIVGGKNVGEVRIAFVGGGEEGMLRWEGNRIVAPARISATYKDFSVEADRAIMDRETYEIEAEGNVILKGPGIDVKANSVRYSFKYSEGVAFGVEGHHEQLYFRVRKNEVEDGPAFRRVSDKQVVLTGVSAAACDFPVPHYYIRGSEIVLYLNDRIFVRNAVIYAMGIPVLYLPAYTRSLVDRSPWSFEAGYTKKLGGYLRLGYDYRHSTRVPDYFDPSKYRTRSRGQGRLDLDTFTRRGNGLGLNYEYKLDYGRHRGKLFAYGMSDEDRDVPNEESTPDRAAFRWRHRSRLTDHLLLQLDIDQVTDPDLYYDILDHFERDRSGRHPERRTRMALTYARDKYLARVMMDMRDRVSRDYYRDFSEPTANNLDYDPDPGGREDGTIKGISGRRFAAASRKLPRADFSTAHVKIWELPFFYESDAHGFHALDRGLNPFSRNDDAWIDGGDWHQTLLHRLRFSERYTWTNRAGVGVAYFDRQSERLGADVPTGAAYPYQLDALTLVDRDTWLTGRRQRSFHDVENGLFYYDYQSRMNARFTNTLEGYLQYTYRDVSSDSLGEFYRRIGNRTAQTDIYEFPVKANMLEAFLNHFLLYPNISTYARGGVNLHRDGDIAAYDLLNYIGGGTAYTNDTKELTMSVGADLQERQIRDLSDPNEFQQSNLIYSGKVQYIPRHKRWWAQVGVFAVQVLDRDPVAAPPSERDRFDENRTDVSVSPLVGRQLGPKYTAEVAATYNTRIDDWKSAYIILKRDLHDLEASVQAGVRRVEEIHDNELQVRRENEIRFSVRLKTPRSPQDENRSSNIRTLVDDTMQTEFAD